MLVQYFYTLGLSEDKHEVSNYAFFPENTSLDVAKEQIVKLLEETGDDFVGAIVLSKSVIDFSR